MSELGSSPIAQSHSPKPKKIPVKEDLLASSLENGTTVTEAEAESDALGRGNLETQARQNHHLRKEKAKDHFAQAMVWGVWIGFALGVIVVLSWILHFILPVHYLWLNEAQLEILKQIIHVGAATVGGYLLNHFKNYLDG